VRELHQLDLEYFRDRKLMKTHDSRINWTAGMGPCLKWEGFPEDNPTCNGSCAYGWTQDPDTKLWLCGACRKPSHCYLRECDACEQIYLPTPAQLQRVQANVLFRYTLDHPEGEC